MRHPRTKISRFRVTAHAGEEDLWIEALRGTTERRSGVRARVADTDVILKAGPIARPLRTGLRAIPAGGRVPAEREALHLEWLRRRLFRCVEPIATAVELRRGLPVAQLFASREVPGARPLEEAWPDAAAAARERWAHELGTELGRMHALRFLHADLFPRNLLVAAPAEGGPGHGRELVFLDAWAGGPTAWTRGQTGRLERDLGCFFTEAPEWMAPDHQGRLLAAYAAARAANGRPVDGRGRWLERARRARLAEVRQLEAKPARRRGRALPQRDWSPPVP